MQLGIFSQSDIPILLPLCLIGDFVSALPFPRFLLVWLPNILTTGQLAFFFKLMQVSTLYNVQEHCSTEVLCG